MKTSHLSFEHFSASPLLGSDRSTAHSGPELVNNVPNEELAHALASSLLQDRTVIIEHPSRNSFPNHDGFTDLKLRRL